MYGASRYGQSTPDLLCAIETDQMFTIPATRLAGPVPPHSKREAYRLSWPTPAVGGKLGDCHLIELPLVFDELDSSEIFTGSDPPQDLAAARHGSWVGFAASGDPTVLACRRGLDMRSVAGG